MAIVRLRPADLQHAIADGTLSLQFQPQVQIASGKLLGVEAFVRWPHPAYGLVGPGDIVPLLDQGDLHLDFDRWVLGELCAQVKRWGGEGVDIPVAAANVWAQTLRAAGAVDMVRDAVAQSGVDATRIEIECPKGSVRDLSLAEPVQRIRALGIRTCSEEFGDPAIADAASGFDTLKVGYPLARDLEALGSGAAEAVGAIVAAAKRVGARVVADSVETAEQEALLSGLGCEIVQGRLYGPEVAAEELKTLLAPHAE